MLGEAAHHAHPLRRGRDGDLTLEHGHGVGQRAHAVPAQLHVVVQAAAHHVRVVVVQAGQDGAALQVDAPRAGAGQRQHLGIVADRDETAVLTATALARGRERSSVVMRPLWKMTSGVAVVMAVSPGIGQGREGSTLVGVLVLALGLGLPAGQLPEQMAHGLFLVAGGGEAEPLSMLAHRNQLFAHQDAKQADQRHSGGAGERTCNRL